MSKKIDYWYVCHKGLRRTINQDNYYVPNKAKAQLCPNVESVRCGSTVPGKSAVFAIFDGMGGEECGEMASYLCTGYLDDFFFHENAQEDLASFCMKANSKVVEYAKENDIYSMGSTAALARVDDCGVTTCNLGDSRIYRIGPCGIELISFDHCVSYAGRKSYLYQYVGIPEKETLIEPYIAQCEYRANDLFLLCSDGLSDFVSESTIYNIVIRNALEQGDGQKAAELMLAEALEAGGKDNISFILLQI